MVVRNRIGGCRDRPLRPSHARWGRSAGTAPAAAWSDVTGPAAHDYTFVDWIYGPTALRARA
ncbi:hypothetical protein Rrhod_1595 [Rhodococcus rhodnii LMG 5362]|uniref:Uncharacterized protein n=1 Tax=Rhodococcus rhodnii LMG 5362 TaxID=1273125 RepID=R7WNS6_9NOCA|nr:hypothetical protein Rrhod_1595 [Rhodococcus rhodnii LMG 5362]